MSSGGPRTAAALPGLGPALPPGFQSPSALELGFSYSDGKPLTDSPFNWRFLLSFALSPWPLSPCWLCESSEPLLFLGTGQNPHMLSRLLGTPSLTGLREWESHSEPHRKESAGVHAGCDMVKLGLLQGRGRGGGLTWS